MDNSFFAYLQHLELMAFFSGYPLMYAVVIFFSGNSKRYGRYKINAAVLLSFAYALVGTLFLGLQLKKLHDGNAAGGMAAGFQQPWLIIWGLLAILFWVPRLAKKPMVSLLHSCVFFFLLLKDLYLQAIPPNSGGEVLKNDMNIYTSSLLLNAAAFAVVAFFSSVCFKYKTRLKA
jgi:hypothetical protein